MFNTIKIGETHRLKGCGTMFILNHKRLVQEKIEKLTNGETAYAESQEVIRLVKRELIKKKLVVLMDETEIGCWFIPQKTNSTLNDTTTC